MFVILLICSPVHAQTNYEILLGNDFKEFNLITHPLLSVPDSEKFKNINKAYDIMLNVLENYPSSITACSMLDLIEGGILWDKDKIMLEKYQKLKDKCMNNLDDPNTNSAEKLMFMRIAADIEYVLTSGNEKELNNMSIKCNAGLLKMKNECTNPDYAALAHIALSRGADEKGNVEFIQKYPEHPYVQCAEQNLITIKYYWTENPDYNKYISETEKLCEKYKENYMPGGYSSEIGLYIFYIGIYHRMKDREKVLYYLKLLKEKAPDNDSFLNFETIYNKEKK